MSKELSREDILNVHDCPMERVEVPEWGGYVFVMGLSANMLDEFQSSILVKSRNGMARDVNTLNVRAKLLVRCLCTENRELLFSIEDVQRLGKKSAVAMERCFDVAQRLSGISDKAVQEAEKNFETDQNAGSNSVSPSL